MSCSLYSRILGFPCDKANVSILIFSPRNLSKFLKTYLEMFVHIQYILNQNTESVVCHMHQSCRKVHTYLVLLICECTDNLIKWKYVCTIFSVLISLYVNSRLNGFHELMVFTIIVFHNTRENISIKPACT